MAVVEPRTNRIVVFNCHQMQTKGRGKKAYKDLYFSSAPSPEPSPRKHNAHT